MQKYAYIDKRVGETPLVALERFRVSSDIPATTPLAYAGRLDPMASGKLLILIGDECKKQTQYHALDKEYVFMVLFGVSSDTGDVLGRITVSEQTTIVTATELDVALENLPNTITLPYPNFSAKTVAGKPLHQWTLEERLDEIEIPTYSAQIFSLRQNAVTERSGAEIADTILEKIETIPSVTDSDKTIGRDFRRREVRADWQTFRETHADDIYSIATITCTCSSGLYMRSLAEIIAQKLGTTGLAFHIHRSYIGRFRHIFGIPYWKKP